MGNLSGSESGIGLEEAADGQNEHHKFTHLGVKSVQDLQQLSRMA